MVDSLNLEIVMSLIAHGGDAKGNAVEAIQAAKEGNFELANEKIETSEKSLIEAHRSQTGLLQAEASGNSIQPSLLMIHGQDHLMTAICFKDLAIEIVDLYKRITK